MLRMYEISDALLVSVSYSIIQRKGRRKRCLLSQDMGFPPSPLQPACREQLLWFSGLSEKPSFEPLVCVPGKWEARIAMT